MTGTAVDTAAVSEELITLVVAVSGFVMVSLWWMARRFARGGDDPRFAGEPDQ